MALLQATAPRRVPVLPHTATPDSAKRPTVGTPGHRVLVADDNALVRTSLVRFLSMHKLEVNEAIDGPTAVETCYRVRPDLVLMDVDMPGFDGFEACRRLKSDSQSSLVPVLFLTAMDSPEGRQKGAEVGGDGYLTKPVHLAEMIARVRAGLKQKQLTDALGTAEATLRAQASQIEARDPRSVGHSRRVAKMADKVAEKMGLSQEMRRTIVRAAEVHDIGKIVVPESILLKTGPLSEAELAIVRMHPVAGEQMCAAFREYKSALPIIRHHHERRDGKGYPDCLVGDEIPIGARVLQVVEVFDALMTERPESALNSQEALATIENGVRQGWWDAEVFAAFRTTLAGGVTTGALRMAAAPVQ